MRTVVAIVFVSMMAACTHLVGDLMLLTRDGCVQTDEMRAHLDAALVKAGWPTMYQVVDLATLSPEDPRRGYPTPTLLYAGHDVYGMPVPASPSPEPT